MICFDPRGLCSPDDRGKSRMGRVNLHKRGEMIDIERPARTRDSSKQTFYFSDFSVISFELWILYSYYFHVEPTVLFFFSFFVALKECVA